MKHGDLDDLVLPSPTFATDGSDSQPTALTGEIHRQVTPEGHTCPLDEETVHTTQFSGMAWPRAEFT
jgi:hypothetical protein